MMSNALRPARVFLQQQLPQGGRVLCAVSGGLDSMCLLDFACRQKTLQITAAHFNHQLRGMESDRDEAFVRRWCEEHEIPFVCGRGDVRAHAAETGQTLEEAARVLRYTFLETVGSEFDAILTAHHADDNAETMLLNLIRGTGSAGLAGIPRVRGKILRPFLPIARQTLAEYAAERGLPYMEDSTNLDPDVATRNALRLRVMPLLREINPRAVENMSFAAGVIERENRGLDRMAAEYAAQAEATDTGLRIRRLTLLEAPLGLAERAALTLLASAAGQRKDLTSVHVEALLALAERGNGFLDLPYGLNACCDKQWLHIDKLTPLPAEMPILPDQEIMFGDWLVSFGAQSPPQSICYRVSLPEGGALTVSGWKNADRMTISGSRGSRSVKRLASDRGCPPAERDRLPVLRVDGRPAVIPGIGVNEEFTPGETGQAILVTFLKQTEEKSHDEK